MWSIGALDLDPDCDSFIDALDPDCDPSGKPPMMMGEVSSVSCPALTTTKTKTICNIE